MHIKHISRHGIKKITARLLKDLSFRREPSFIPNLVMCVGIVFVRRGMWNLMDEYFFPENKLLSNILAVIIGIFIIYLPDNSFTQLGGVKKNEEVAQEIAQEISKIIK